MIHSHFLHLQSFEQTSYTWTVQHLAPFDELLISWNAYRPLRGHYVILSRVLIQNLWSPWLLYAVWGSREQFSFHDTTTAAPVHSFQDQVEILDQKVATGFCLRIEACNGASLDHFYSLYACTSKLGSPSPTIWSPPSHSISPLSVPGISQLLLNHPRAHGFCSPTSTTAVIQSFVSHQQLSPLCFARHVYDSGFDIYGNWAFNIAQAFVELFYFQASQKRRQSVNQALGSHWQCFYTRIKDIQWLWWCLGKGIPVVISVKGTLPGSFLPYSNGHLMVIKGYDAMTQHFLCMDPAFPSNEETEVAYPWQALMQAWERRHYLTYFFIPQTQAYPKMLAS